jgi:hypothetical protein
MPRGSQRFFFSFYAYSFLGALCVLCSEKFSHEALAKVAYSVIPAKAGIQSFIYILDSGSRFACPE